MTLKYSGKSFPKCVWKADQESWARLHEEAFHALGGCPRYVVLDNLKAGVLRPDLYESELNPERLENTVGMGFERVALGRESVHAQLYYPVT